MVIFTNLNEPSDTRNVHHVFIMFIINGFDYSLAVSLSSTNDRHQPCHQNEMIWLLSYNMLELMRYSDVCTIYFESEVNLNDVPLSRATKTTCCATVSGEASTHYSKGSMTNNNYKVAPRMAWYCHNYSLVEIICQEINLQLPEYLPYTVL